MEVRVVSVTLDEIHKRFDANEVLKGISLSAHHGEVISVLGPSGSGKSTLLRCINLLEVPDSGRLFVSGEEVLLKKTRDNRTVPADMKQVERIRSKLAMVFQQFNLWSHLTILQNVIEAPVHVLKVPRQEAIDRAKMYLDKVGIPD